MATCLIGLGANLGTRARALDDAVARLKAVPELQVAAISTWHETAPAGGPADQPGYLNGAVRVETTLAPHAVLARLQQIENELGRERQVRWGPRTIDLDLLLYDQQVVHTPTLEIPHPRMAVRRFVLDPAREIGGELIHPTMGWTIDQLAEHLRASPRYMAVCGLLLTDATQLAAQVADRLAGRLLTVPTRVGGSAGSPSPVFERELELIERRAQRVAKAIDEAPQCWIVSDFWLPQSLAYGQVVFSAAENQRLREHCLGLTGRMPPARFVVGVERLGDRLWAELQQSNPAWNDLDAKRFGQHAAALNALLHQTGWGPVLHVGSDSAGDEQIVAEMVAAAQASDHAGTE